MPAMTHGATRAGGTTPEFRAWINMRSRCFNPKNAQFADYGGRGVTVCARWQESFADFLSDVGLRPSSAHSIDRADVNGNYEPGNVRWATRVEQNRNRRNNRVLTLGAESLPLCVWAERLGVKREAIRDRIMRGWSIERALTEPFRADSNGTNNGAAKLDDERVRQIRRDAAAGESHRSIGVRFGVSQTVVSDIVRRDRWRHVA